MLTKKESQKSENSGSKTTKNNAQAQATRSPAAPPPAKAPTQQPAKSTASQTDKQPCTVSYDQKGHPKTRVTIKYDVGFSNQLYIRGKGANLSWEKGVLLVNTKPDEWVWETDANFNQCEFKVLINDQNYENGENHLLNAGATLLYSPSFPSNSR